LYKYYFNDADYRPIIKTRDIDFLLPEKPVFQKEVDIEELMKPLGFEISFYGKGYMKLESDELILEFLIPEIGRSSEKPYPLKALKFNAQPLRHLSLLWRNPIKVSISGISCRIPHPADYCLQKLIAAANRKTADKRNKDRQAVKYLIKALEKNNDLEELYIAYRNLTKKQEKWIKRELTKIGYESLPPLA